VTAIRKAVFPAAGLGTRFLPATKAQPKEMLPIVDKPSSSTASKDGGRASTRYRRHGPGQAGHRRPFDISFELEHYSRIAARRASFSSWQNLDLVDITYIHQKEPLGLGTRVMAKDVVGNEPFAVFLADDSIRCILLRSNK